MIILEVTKSLSFTLSLEDTFFKKPQGRVKLTPSIAGLIKKRNENDKSANFMIKKITKKYMKSSSNIF